MVGRAYRIGQVAEIDLELIRRVLGHRTFGRQVLGGAEVGDPRQEALAVLQRLQPVDLTGRGVGQDTPRPGRRAPEPAPAADRTRARARTPPAARGRRTVRPPRKNGARIGEERAAAVLAEPREHLSAAVAPGHGRKRRPVDQARPVGVALFPDQPRSVDVHTASVDAVDRAREGKSGDRPLECPDAQPLAAGDPGEVGKDHVEGRRAGMAAFESPPHLLGCCLVGPTSAHTEECSTPAAAMQ